MFAAIINGPNLNLLGKREPEIYGHASMEDILPSLEEDAARLSEGCTLRYFQSNCEGDLIDAVQSMGFDKECLGIVINPGAYAHYSYALADALRAIPVKAVEVHISNIHAREEFRSRSVTASACAGVITGLGLNGYALALQALLQK